MSALMVNILYWMITNNDYRSVITSHVQLLCQHAYPSLMSLPYDILLLSVVNAPTSNPKFIMSHYLSGSLNDVPEVDYQS